MQTLNSQRKAFLDMVAGDNRHVTTVMMLLLVANCSLITPITLANLSR